MKVKDIKEFISKLPSEFDEFNVVNGEENQLGVDEYTYRIDKPVLSALIDEETKELVFLHESSGELSLEDLESLENLEPPTPKEGIEKGVD